MGFSPTNKRNKHGSAGPSYLLGPMHPAIFEGVLPGSTLGPEWNISLEFRPILSWPSFALGLLKGWDSGQKDHPKNGTLNICFEERAAFFVQVESNICFLAQLPVRANPRLDARVSSEDMVWCKFLAAEVKHTSSHGPKVIWFLVGWFWNHRCPF